MNNPATHPATDPTQTDQAQAADPGAGPGPADPLDKMTDQILAEAPGISAEFADKVQAQARAEIGQAADPDPDPGQGGDPGEPLRDKSGFIFDPKYVQVSRDGQPRMTPGGSWEMRKDKTGKRYQRDQVLRRRINGKRPKVVKVEIPPDLDPDQVDPVDQVDPADQAQAAQGIPAGPMDPHLEKAHTLAMICDEAFWTVSNVVADSSVVQEYKKGFSEPGKAALVAGFSTLEDLPDPPWWVYAGMIYGPALAGMIAHEKSKPKRIRIKEKIAGWIIRWKERKRQKSGHIPQANVMAGDRVNEFR